MRRKGAREVLQAELAAEQTAARDPDFVLEGGATTLRLDCLAGGPLPSTSSAKSSMSGRSMAARADRLAALVCTRASVVDRFLGIPKCA